MTDTDKLEGYLITMGFSFEKIDDSTWLINEPSKGLNNVVIFLDSPVVVVRVHVMNAPLKDRETFFAELLKMNATELVHGAYALDGEKLILLDTHLIQTLDLEELQTTLDAFSLALAQHFNKLSAYRN